MTPRPGAAAAGGAPEPGGRCNKAGTRETKALRSGFVCFFPARRGQAGPPSPSEERPVSSWREP